MLGLVLGLGLELCLGVKKNYSCSNDIIKVLKSEFDIEIKS